HDTSVQASADWENNHVIVCDRLDEHSVYSIPNTAGFCINRAFHLGFQPCTRRDSGLDTDRLRRRFHRFRNRGFSSKGWRYGGRRLGGFTGECQVFIQSDPKLSSSLQLEVIGQVPDCDDSVAIHILTDAHVLYGSLSLQFSAIG